MLFSQQGNGHLRNGSGAVGGDIADGDPFFLGGSHIHHIIAGGQNADVPDGRAGIQHLLGNWCFVGNDSVGIADAGDRLVAMVGSFFWNIMKS